MTHASTHWRGVERAALDWDERGNPFSRNFSDVYYSGDKGLEEAEHVFIEGNELPRRWGTQRSRSFSIFETGFGTGLNFLATWSAWRTDTNAPRHLYFLSVERYPLGQADLERALHRWPALAELSSELVANYPPPLPGRHRILLDQGRVTLDLVFNDVEAGLRELLEVPGLRANAWFLDGFAPARNPGMWSEELCSLMAQLSHRNASFATFTAAGDVRRGLQRAGFEVQKRAGFAHKREMLVGRLSAVPAPGPAQSTPWHLSTAEPVDCQRVLIIGAGLAGCTAAAALHRRGVKVKVLDSGPVAGAASGNRQGVLYTRVSHRPSALNDFSLHSYAFALRYYQQLLRNGQLEAGLDIDFCGSLHLAELPPPESPLHKTIASLSPLVDMLNSDQAAEISGIPGTGSGLFFPGSGWVNPPGLCSALLASTGIEVAAGLGQLDLQRNGENWVVKDLQGREVERANRVIIACGAQSRGFKILDWLPLQSIRGQVTHLDTGEITANLSTVLCHEGYLPPPRNGRLCLGASFNLDDDDTAMRGDDQVGNIGKLLKAIPQLEPELGEIDPEQLDGWVGFRAASPDYLPMAGPAPDLEAFIKVYSGLRKNARRPIPSTGPYLPGLYLSCGHGSRGLTSAPLCAELLASDICGEPWPVDVALYRALAPARFIIRDLTRNRL